MDLNVLVTFPQTERVRAEEEVTELLSEAGLVLEDMVESGVAGLMMLKVGGDGKEAMRKLRAFAFRFPERFRHTCRWIPIEVWASSDPQAMVEVITELGSRIGEGDRWRMDLEKRHYRGGSSQDLVRMLAEHVEHGIVDLDGPEVMLQVQIIGGIAGFSLVSEDEFLDVNQMRILTGLSRTS